MIVLGIVTPFQSRPGAGLGDSEWLSIQSPPPPPPPSLMCRCSGCHNCQSSGTVSATAHQSASSYAGACVGRVTKDLHGKGSNGCGVGAG